MGMELVGSACVIAVLCVYAYAMLCPSSNPSHVYTQQGRPGKVVADWLRDAKGRLLVEQAVRAMSARSALLNSSLV